MKKIVISLLMINLLFNIVNAKCFNADINNWAEKLEVKFEEKDSSWYNSLTNKQKVEAKDFSYFIMLNNVREDLFVRAKDTYSNDYYKVDYDELFKNYIIGSEIHFNTKEYTIEIYMKEDAKYCGGELIKVINYSVPGYNRYSDTLYCENNKDDKKCQTYSDVKITDKMQEKANKHYLDKIKESEEAAKPLYQKILKEVFECSLFIIIPLVILVIFYSIMIKKIKKRSEDK